MPNPFPPSDNLHPADERVPQWVYRRDVPPPDPLRAEGTDDEPLAPLVASTGGFRIGLATGLLWGVPLGAAATVVLRWLL